MLVKSENLCFRHAPFTAFYISHQPELSPGAVVYNTERWGCMALLQLMAHVTSLSLIAGGAGGMEFSISQKNLVLMRFRVKHVQFGQNACDQSVASLWWQ